MKIAIVVLFACFISLFKIEFCSGTVQSGKRYCQSEPAIEQKCSRVLLQRKMFCKKNLILTLAKVVVAIGCVVNIGLLQLDLCQFKSHQFWNAFVPFYLMIGVNAFLLAGIWDQNTLAVYLWYTSYVMTIIFETAFIIGGQWPYFMPIASPFLNDAIIKGLNLKQTEGPIYAWIFSLLSVLLVWVACCVLSLLDASQRPILPLSQHDGSSNATRDSPADEAIQQVLSSLPPPSYTEVNGKLPTYTEAIALSQSQQP